MKRCMTKCLIWPTLLGLLTLSSSLLAEVFIYQLKHQPAEKLIPIIKPHLSAKTSLSAADFKLIVSGEPADNIKVKQMLADLDTPFKEYLVQLRITSVPLKNHQQTSQLQLRGTSEQSQQKAIVKKYRTDQMLADDREFVVRLIENYQGFINTGESYPEVKLINQYGHLIPSSGRKKVQSGVYISVTAAGEDKVAIKASAYQQQRQTTDSRNINTSSATSQILAPTNQWTLLASSEQNTQQQTGKYSTRMADHKTRYYYVKVKQSF